MTPNLTKIEIFKSGTIGMPKVRKLACLKTCRATVVDAFKSVYVICMDHEKKEFFVQKKMDHNNGIVRNPQSTKAYFLPDRSTLLICSWKKIYLKSLRFDDEYPHIKPNTQPGSLEPQDEEYKAKETSYSCIEGENSEFISRENDKEDREDEIDHNKKFKRKTFTDMDIRKHMLTDASSVNSIIGLCPDIFSLGRIMYGIEAAGVKDK